MSGGARRRSNGQLTGAYSAPRFCDEAPVNVAWSEKNRSPLVRVPARRGLGTRCEVRMPDGIARPDRLTQVLGAFVDAATLGTQQAEVGVGSRHSRLVT